MNNFWYIYTKLLLQKACSHHVWNKQHKQKAHMYIVLSLDSSAFWLGFGFRYLVFLDSSFKCASFGICSISSPMIVSWLQSLSGTETGSGTISRTESILWIKISCSPVSSRIFEQNRVLPAPSFSEVKFVVLRAGYLSNWVVIQSSWCKQLYWIRHQRLLETEGIHGETRETKPSCVNEWQR